MIVKCEQCQSRFKIPDAKVTDKGVKVRCTKCQHVFRVTRTSEAAAAPAPPPEVEPPRRLEPVIPPRVEEPAPVSSGSLLDDLGWDLPEEAASSEAPAPVALSSEDGPEPQGPSELLNIPPAPEQPVAAAAPSLLDLPSPSDEPGTGSPESSVKNPPLRARGSSRPAGARSPVEKKLLPPANKMGGLIINVILALALIVVLTAAGNLYVTEGASEGPLLSLKGLRSVFASHRGLVTRDVSNGIYETRAGAAVLFVRGQVENRTQSATRIRVHAEIWDGSQLVKTLEGLAGASATPEDVYGLTSPEDVRALNGKLSQTAVVVPPGGRVPFILNFDSHPEELNGLRLKVVASAPAR